MGFYVRILESEVIIKRDQKKNIFKAWCALNHSDNDHLKHAGSWSGGQKIEAWFSWMEPDYDKTCTHMEDILSMLGFDFEINSQGDIHNLEYDSKMGDEQLFFDRAAPYIENGYIHWQGEDDEDYYWIFDEGKLREFGANGIEAVKVIKEKQHMKLAIDDKPAGAVLKV